MREGSSRAFGWTAQSITLPDNCRTKGARFQFQAKGQNAWRLMDPGWYVDTVKVNCAVGPKGRGSIDGCSARTSADSVDTSPAQHGGGGKIDAM